MSEIARALPVVLLTGFLGSGKTTLLAALVRNPAFADTAVVINEFGDIGLDHLLVGQADDTDVMLLDSGCLCCVGNSSLQETLESLHYRRLRNKIPAFSRVIVETSGLADPGPIINTLAADPLIARHYVFAGAITAVDAVHGLTTLNDYREAAIQTSIADRIVLTKTDQVDADAVQALRLHLQARNPSASLRVITPQNRDRETPRLFDGLQASHVDVVPAAKMPPATPLAHVLRYGIVSRAWRQPHDSVMTWETYAAWVQYVQRHLSERLLRAKGILRWDDDIVRVIHGVRHVFSHPQPLHMGPDRANGNLILIVQQADATEIDAVFARL